MNEASSLDAIRQLSFLKDLPEEDLVRIASSASIVSMEPGDTVFREGETSSMIFILLEGRVAIEICAPGVGCKRVLTASAGELLGWSPILGNSPFTATARAITETRAIALDAASLLEICERYPKVGFEFMRRTAQAISRRLHATRMQLIDIYGPHMAEAELVARPTGENASE